MTFFSFPHCFSVLALFDQEDPLIRVVRPPEPESLREESEALLALLLMEGNKRGRYRPASATHGVYVNYNLLSFDFEESAYNSSFLSAPPGSVN